MIWFLMDRVGKYFAVLFSWGTLNTGAPLGFFPGSAILFGVLSILVGVLLCRAETVILLGALSNAIDRLFIGGVIDYIPLPLPMIHKILYFNIADMMIAVGFIVYSIRRAKAR